MLNGKISLNFFQKLFLSFTFLTLIPLSVIYFSINLSLEKLNELSMERMQEKKALILVELDMLGNEIQRAIDLIKTSRDIQKTQRELAAKTFIQSNFLSAASQLMDQTGFDFLDILDQDGKIRSSGHWPMAWDTIEEIDRMFVKTYPDQPVFRWEKFKGGQAISLQVASKTEEKQGQFLILCGGYRVDKQLLINRLSKKIGSLVFFFSPHKERLTVVDQGFSFSDEDLLEIKQFGILFCREKQAGSLFRIELNGISYDVDTILLREGPVADQSQGELLGALFLGLSVETLQGPQKTLKKAMLPLVLATLVVSLLVSVLLSRRITRPVQSLVEATREVASGNLEQSIPVTSGDEIGMLVQSFNTMTRQLVESKKQLIVAERVAAWQEIARRLAHEIKNPLSPIQLSIETLQKTYERQHPDFDEILRESTQAIIEEVNSLKRIVNEFANFARMPAPNKERININDVITSSIKLYAGLPKNITLETKLKEDLPDAVLDRELFSQVLKNLIGNALDAMKKQGTITIETLLNESPSGNVIILCVSDTGMGMSEEEMENVFTPYFTTKKGGTGLGLSIVHRIVSDHGGSIHLDSKPDCGTTITIELPPACEKI